MTEHDAVRARFGELFDDPRAADPALDGARTHLGACTACAAEWRAYTRAVDALRAPAAATRPAHVGAVLARVAAARAAGAATAPVGVGQADGPRAAAPDAAAGGGRRPRLRALATHAVAVAAGVAVAVALTRGVGPRGEAVERPGSPGAPVQLASAGDGAAERVERRRAPWLVLPLPVPVPTPGEAPRPVRTQDPPPAIAPPHATSEALARALAALGATLARLESAAVPSRERPSPGPESLAADSLAADSPGAGAPTEAPAGAPTDPDAASDRAPDRFGAPFEDEGALAAAGAPPAAGAPERAPVSRPGAAAEGRPERGGRPEPVVIRREGERVVLATSGALDEVVAALLARIDDPDAAVRAAIELRLAGIADDLGVARGAARADRGRGEPWWRSSEAEVAALDAPPATREAWPDWWARARQDGLR